MKEGKQALRSTNPLTKSSKTKVRSYVINGYIKCTFSHKFQRLTIWASCPMNLQKFPLDSQVCPLQIGSFGYSAEDIIYKWAKPTAVSLDEIGMAQFLLKDYQSYETIAVSNRRTK